VEGILRAEPGHALVALWRARILCAMGRYGDVLHVVETVPAEQRGLNLMVITAHAVAGLGRGDEARTKCRDVAQGFERAQISNNPNLATVHAMLGDAESAYIILERAFENRSSYMPFIRDPLNDALRRDPRVCKLVARLDLPV
jgi:hypothetical protein